MGPCSHCFQAPGASPRANRGGGDGGRCDDRSESLWDATALAAFGREGSDAPAVGVAAPRAEG